VSDLIDSGRVGTGRVVAYTEGEIGEHEAPGVAINLEHHAKLAGGRRTINLYASWQPRSVLGFAVAGE
jgi:hypothetical protein